jgi:YaiO family outer membrane protein
MKFVIQNSAIFCAIVCLSGGAVAQTGTGSVQLGYSQSQLSDNFPRWRDTYVRGHVDLGESIGILSWDASQQKHFNETGEALSTSLTHNFNADWYGVVGVGVGSNASFLSKQRIDLAVYRKWLSQRQWVTGVQFMASNASDDVHNDRSWQLTSSYYFNAPFVAEAGVKRNTSNPGNVGTNRVYLAATYGEVKKQYLSARYDTGREGYLPQIVNLGATNFKSHVTTITWRQWVQPKWGYELQAERYNNPFYNRSTGSVSLFYDF